MGVVPEGAITDLGMMKQLAVGVIGLLAFGYLFRRLIGNSVRVIRSGGPWHVRAWHVATLGATANLFTISLTHYPLAEVNAAFFFAMMWGVALALPAPAQAEGVPVESA